MNNPAIINATFWKVSVPYLEEWTSSEEFGPHSNGSKIIVRLQDSEGHAGWGEGIWRLTPDETKESLGRLLGRAPGELRSSFLNDLAPAGEAYWSRPAPPSPLTPPVENLRHRLRHGLQLPVETAVIDLIARRAGLPFSAFFGGAWRTHVASDYWMGRTTPAHAARCAKRAVELGFVGIKLKTTLEDPNVERLKAIRTAAGESFGVTVDPNGRFYRLDDARPTLREMDAVGNMSILEDAFPRTALDETRELRRLLNARVVVHIDPPESLAQILEAKCCGGLNLDSHSQGLASWQKQAAVADQFNLPVWHGSGLDLGIYTAAQLHLASCTPNCQLPGDQAGPWLRQSTLVRESFEVVNGKIAVPVGAGLGVTPELSEIRQFASIEESVE